MAKKKPLPYREIREGFRAFQSGIPVVARGPYPDTEQIQEIEDMLLGAVRLANLRGVDLSFLAVKIVDEIRVAGQNKPDPVSQ